MPDPLSAASVVTAAAQQGAKAIEAQRQANQKVNDALIDKVKDTPEFSTAVEAYGKRQAMKQVIMTGLFEKLCWKLGLADQYFKEGEFYRELGEKTESIPEENLQTPKASVALPAMQGLSYSLDEPSLKDLYLNLLATASNSSVAVSAHPSFVEIIRQLTAEEAALLPRVVASPASPLIRIETTESAAAGFDIIQTHVMNWTDAGGEPILHPFSVTYVDNWMRLGLVEVWYGEWLTDAGAYEWVEARPEVVMARTMYENDRTKVSVARGVLRVTSFGAQFAKSVGII